MQRRILRVVPVIIVVSLALIVSGLAFAGSVRYSRHDFSVSSYLNSPDPSKWAGAFAAGGVLIDEVCVFCHTPHHASTDNTNNRGLNTLLWNRSAPVATSYNVYQSTTLNATVSNPPTGISLMCMSCHDGITAIAAYSLSGSFAGYPDTLLSGFPGNPNITFDNSVNVDVSDGYIGKVFKGDQFAGWGPNIGNLTAAGTADLSNDHPVSFNWPVGAQADPDLYDPATIKASYPKLRLYGAANRMECSTCHNVHDPDIRPFLAMSNSQSVMCLACHKK